MLTKIDSLIHVLPPSNFMIFRRWHSHVVSSLSHFSFSLSLYLPIYTCSLLVSLSLSISPHYLTIIYHIDGRYSSVLQVSRRFSRLARYLLWSRPHLMQCFLIYAHRQRKASITWNLLIKHIFYDQYMLRGCDISILTFLFIISAHYIVMFSEMRLDCVLLKDSWCTYWRSNW